MEIEIIKNSKTKAQAIMSLFGYDNGSSRRKFEKLISEKQIDISHFVRRERIYERIIKKCPVCDHEFEIMKGHKREKITCSHSCANTYFRSGTLNPNWNEDYYRTTCFIHHKKECIICGEIKIVVVHHYDENKKNNSPENLIPLCPTHHQYVHSRYKDNVIGKIDEFRKNFINQNKDINIGT